MAWAVCACACVRLGWAGMGEREDTSDRSCVARKTGRVPGNRPLIDYEALALECSYHANWREKEKARSLQTLWLQLHGDEPRARSQQQRERQRHQSRLPGFWGPPVQSFLPSGEESRTLRRHVDPSADWTLGSHRGPLLENGRAAEPGGKVGVWGVGAATGGRDIPLLQALVPRCTSCTLPPWIPPSMDPSSHTDLLPFFHRVLRIIQPRAKVPVLPTGDLPVAASMSTTVVPRAQPAPKQSLTPAPKRGSWEQHAWLAATAHPAQIDALLQRGPGGRLPRCWLSLRLVSDPAI